MTKISYGDQAVAVNDLLFQELADGESVFLNLNNENYYGLDLVGTDIWKALTTSNTIQEAYDKILSEYEVEEKVFKKDFDELLNNLLENGLMEIVQK